VIAKALLLLEGGVMLFIDDDKAQFGKGGKQCRAGADQDRRLARPAGEPGFQPLPVIHGRMQGEHRGVKAAAEAAQGLGGEADLRHQHQHLLAASQHGGDDLQIDLGLARAGDAIEQKDAKASLLVDVGYHHGLLGAKARRILVVYDQLLEPWLLAAEQIQLADQPLLLHRLEDRAIHPLGAQIGTAYRSFAQSLQQLLLARGPA